MREEYVEQAHFFKAYLIRIADNLPAQEILTSIAEEVLATTNLPKAIEVMRGEIVLNGKISSGMRLLPHYFTPFQTYVMAQAEEEKSRFTINTALKILHKLAKYMSKKPTRAGLFIYQFESLSRNRLGYDDGMNAIAQESFYDDAWQDWIKRVLFNLGEREFADMLYHRSEHFVLEHRHRTRNPDYLPDFPIFFGRQEGKIAKANFRKDPLYMFSALQRQLGYPKVPRPKKKSEKELLPPAVELRIQRLEQRLQLLESETKNNFDLSEFYQKPE